MKKPRIFIFALSLIFLIIAIVALVRLVYFAHALGDPSSGLVGELDIYTVWLAAFVFGGILIAHYMIYEFSATLSLAFAIISTDSSLRGIRIAACVTLALLVLSFVALIVLFFI